MVMSDISYSKYQAAILSSQCILWPGFLTWNLLTIFLHF